MTKSMKLIVVVALIAMIAATASAQNGFANKRDMLGGKHDLTGYTGFGKTTTWSSGAVTSASSVCSYCHTAHDNTGTADRTFLWTHAVPTTFGTAYTSPTLQGTENVSASDSTAKCLGCHDGTLAVTSGAYGTAPTTGEYGTDTTGGKLNAASGLIVPLARTHPVSIAYTAASAPAHNMRVPQAANSVDGAGVIPLFNGQMECATCHDPHINGGTVNGVRTSGVLIRAFPTGAGIDAPTTAAQGSKEFCLYCHQ